MQIISDTLPGMFDNYFRYYEDLFRRDEAIEQFRLYTTGLLIEGNRKTMSGMARQMIMGDPQRLHHFLNNSSWEAEELNLRRIELLQIYPQTRVSKDGWLVQDDTGSEKRPGVTHGVARQYIGQVGKVSDGQVVVTTHYVDSNKHYPLYLDLYWPKAALDKAKENNNLPEGFSLEYFSRDKIDIALSQAREAKEYLGLSRALADSWYGSSPKYLLGLRALGMEYVVTIKPNRKLFLERGQKHPELRADEVLTFLKAKDFSQVKIPLSDGSFKIRYYAWIKDVKLKSLPKTKHLLVVVVDNPNRIDPEETDFLISFSQTEISPEEVVRAYSLRNWVETFYREAKSSLGFSHAQVRTQKAFLRHWNLVFVAYSLICYHQLLGGLGRISEKKGSVGIKL